MSFRSKPTRTERFKQAASNHWDNHGSKYRAAADVAIKVTPVVVAVATKRPISPSDAGRVLANKRWS